MPDLETTLRDHDDGVLFAIASMWGVDTTNRERDEIIEALKGVMLNEYQAEAVWDELTENQRGALLSIITSQGVSQARMFEMIHGKVRKMGRGQIEREEPHKNPESPAEALFYRGLIGESFQKNKKGDLQAIVFIPSDIIPYLPTRNTSYDNLPDEPMSADAALESMPEDALINVQSADTSLIDDMTTFLAYVRMEGAGVMEDEILPIDIERLSPFMINPHPIRIAFLLGVGISAGLITTQEGRAYPKKSGLQKWLNMTRSQQVESLMKAWQNSNLYRELWHIPGLHPDPDASFPYDPTLARETLQQSLAEFVPDSEWWSLDEFIETIKATDPDFQRPNGDYDSWYIRDNSGGYLKGSDSWDEVEGVQLAFTIMNPMHWLGLVDVSENAARLTAFGRAYAGLIDFPHPPEQNENITVGDDAVMVATRKVSRVDRFQLARFTTWGQGVPPYHYRLDAEGIQRGAQQGITTAHIATFLKRHSNGQLPKTIAKLLDTWQGGAAAEVTFERLLVLRTVSPDMLDKLYSEPSIRRYLGAKLGPMAVVIRADQENDLKTALEATGIKVEFVG